MNHHLAEVCTRGIIAQLLVQLQFEIEQRQALKKMPFFLSTAMWSLAVENIIAVMPESGNSLKRGIEEDLLIAVPKLDKDTLMPKDLSEEKVRVSSPQKLSPQSSRSSARKAMNMTQLTSIKLADKLKSISATEKKVSALDKKPTKQQPFSELNIHPDQEEEPLLTQLREKTRIRLQQMEEEAKLKEHRQKYFNQKLKNFNQVIAADQPEADVAFDYDGDPLRRTLLDEEMRLYKIRAGIGYSKRKPKEGFSRLNAPQLSQVDVSRKHRERGESFRALRPLEIPTFYMKNIQANEAKKLKMDEYRRRFGRGYSRLGNQTLQVPVHTKTSSDHQSQKIIVGQAAQTIQGNKKAEGGKTGRKLALPRLHGKYKVLDRYQDH